MLSVGSVGVSTWDQWACPHGISGCVHMGSGACPLVGSVGVSPRGISGVSTHGISGCVHMGSGCVHLWDQWVCPHGIRVCPLVGSVGVSIYGPTHSCSQCSKVLSPSAYATISDTFYCPTHYERLFMQRGSYNAL